MADRKLAFASVTAPTFTLASLATSSTLVAGQESNAIDNTTTKYLDFSITYLITTGTTPTVSKTIELWGIPSVDGGTTYPDVFDGTDSAETATSRDILRSSARLLASVLVSATSNVGYWLNCPSVADRFDGFVPEKFSLFVTHDTAVNLNSTAGNHVGYVRGLYETVA
jgi:hypothetical protein